MVPFVFTGVSIAHPRMFANAPQGRFSLNKLWDEAIDKGRLFGVRLEGRESATIAGLVSELAGRIPKKGEVIEEKSLKFEVLDATNRKVERVRITTVEPKQMKLI